MLENRDAVVIEPTGEVRSVVIWLHGLGADGHDFEDIIPQLALPKDHGIRFIFPHAPLQAVTINGGVKMRAWYDIQQLDLTREVDGQGIAQSVKLLKALLDQQVADGIAMERMMIAGFSQGGVIALHTGLQTENPLAGIVALSTYLPALPTDQIKQTKNCPIFMAHGLMDPVVAYEHAQNALAQLQAFGFSPSWHEYPMQHQVCMAEIDALSEFMQQNLIKNQ